MEKSGVYTNMISSFDAGSMLLLKLFSIDCCLIYRRRVPPNAELELVPKLDGPSSLLLLLEPQLERLLEPHPLPVFEAL